MSNLKDVWLFVCRTSPELEYNRRLFSYLCVSENGPFLSEIFIVCINRYMGVSDSLLSTFGINFLEL